MPDNQMGSILIIQEVKVKHHNVPENIDNEEEGKHRKNKSGQNANSAVRYSKMSEEDAANVFENR